MVTVRSFIKGQAILQAHPEKPRSKLDFVVVPDVAQKNAFDTAVLSEPPYEAVIHTASPYHFNARDARELLDPGTLLL